MTFAARVSQDPSQPIGELVTASVGTSNPIPYIWLSSGFGGTLPTVAQPSNRTIRSIAFNAAKNALAFGSTEINTIGLTIYKWSSTGFDTKYTIPAAAISGAPYYTIAPSTYSIGATVTFSPADNAIAFGVEIADTGQIPFSVYQWDNITGVGSKYIPSFTTPSIIGVLQIAFSPAGDVIVVVGNFETFVWKWSSATGFGAAYTLPSAIQTNDPEGVAFTPSGDAVCFFDGATLFAYPWSYASGFGTRYSNPSPAIPGVIEDVAFSPTGDAIAVAHNTSPYVTVYAWNSSTGFGTKYTNPADLPLARGEMVAFSESGDFLAVGFNSNPMAYVYPWDSSTGFGARFATPLTIPRGYVIAWRGA